MHILLANPRGFCAGVDRAIGIVERALDLFGAPVYVRHEVVHNRFVVNGLHDRGAVFVQDLAEVPDGATVIFSAHGVSQAVRREAAARGLTVFDATCPLVTKVHMEVINHARTGRETILIGHAGHPEVEGTLGQYDESYGGCMHLVETTDDVDRLNIQDPAHLAFVTQTTLSMEDTSMVIEALRRRFPQIQGPRKDDICYATQNRQDAVRKLAKRCDLVLVVGSRTSSNSNRLKELVAKENVLAYLIDGPEDIETRWLTGCNTIGVTAGASAPEILVQEVIKKLRSLSSGYVSVDEIDGIAENVVFSLPRALRPENSA